MPVLAGATCDLCHCIARRLETGGVIVSGNADIELLAQLAPVRDKELVAETQAPEARALLAQILSIPISGSPPRRAAGVGVSHRRRWLAVPAVAVAVAATTIAVLISTSGSSTASAAAATLRKAATVARAQAPLTLGPGQYAYTKSVDAYINTVVPAGGAGAAYNVLVPHVREVWLSRNGGRVYQTNGTPQFPTAQDRQRWIAAGQPDLSEPPMDAKLSPTPPLDLPTDVNALYDHLKHEASAPGDDNPLYLEMFTLIGDSLRETAATPAQRAALYQVAARLPGIQLLGPVKDSAGRDGVAVAMTAESIRHTLTFDPATSALLAEETIAVEKIRNYPAGTQIGYATYLVHAIVDSQTATP
jgi:hypothetical protein